MKQLLVALSFIALVSFIGSTIEHKNIKGVTNRQDSIPIRVYKFVIDEISFTKAEDSISAYVLPFIGKSLTVDDADWRRELYIRCRQRQSQNMKIDTVRWYKPVK